MRARSKILVRLFVILVASVAMTVLVVFTPLQFLFVIVLLLFGAPIPVQTSGREPSDFTVFASPFFIPSVVFMFSLTLSLIVSSIFHIITRSNNSNSSSKQATDSP